MQSNRLKTILKDACDGGWFPEDLEEELGEFDAMILWKKGANGEEIPEP